MTASKTLIVSQQFPLNKCEKKKMLKRIHRLFRSKERNEDSYIGFVEIFFQGKS